MLESEVANAKSGRIPFASEEVDLLPACMDVASGDLAISHKSKDKGVVKLTRSGHGSWADGGWNEVELLNLACSAVGSSVAGRCLSCGAPAVGTCAKCALRVVHLTLSTHIEAYATRVARRN